VTAQAVLDVMNVALLLPFPASNKKIPGFLCLELAGFLSVRRFKAMK
jgi:hypothetical protein